MQRVQLEEAQARLADLLDAAVKGETIVIVRDDKFEFQIVLKAAEKKSRKPGSARGQIWVSDDFDAPLDDFKEYIE